MTSESITQRPAVADQTTSPDHGEEQRLDVLASFGVEDLAGDRELADLARLAARLCDTPIAFVSMVEKSRQRFIANYGSDLRETERRISFCAHALHSDEPLVVPDAHADPRFADNPLVTGDPQIRFYAGAPLISREGATLGTLCVIDPEPRADGLSEGQLDGLRVLAGAVMRRLQSRRGQRQVDDLLARHHGELQRMADFMPVMAWAADRDGRRIYSNYAFQDYTGLPEGSDEPISVHPSDRGMFEASRRQSIDSGERWSGEVRVRRHDGAHRWMLMHSMPLRSADGGVDRWFGTATDVDEEHRLSENRELIARELAHRIKNIFSVITGLISLRSRGKPEAREFADQLVRTIRALDRAQEFVRPLAAERGTDLGGLLDVLTAPYAHAETEDGGPPRVTVDGQSVPIGMRAATPIALVFHELATNSAKYGALSAEGGQVAIALTDTGDNVRVDWRESGGPQVSAPTSTGFGSRLLRMSVESQLSGRLEQDWNDTGLEVRLHLPKDKLSG